jgi:hypothetical protein
MTPEQLIKSKFKEVRKGNGRNGVEFKVKCPFCSGRWKMYINPAYKGGVYNCYKCDHSGPLSELIGKYDLLEQAKSAVQVETPLPTDIKPPGYTVPLRECGSDNPGVQYLMNVRKRSFNPVEISDLYGVRYCTQGNQYRMGDFVYNTTGTLIFPVWMNYKLVGWQSRLLYTPSELEDFECEALGFTKDEDGKYIRPPKYLTNPGFSKGRVLWNYDNARKYKMVVPSEGVFDSMSIGLPGVCTFGTGISDDQARLIKNYWEAAIIMLDPDGTEAQVQELVGKLRRAILVIPVVLSGGYKDPGDTPTQEIWKQIVAEIDRQIMLRDSLALRDLRRYIVGA